MPRRPVPMSFVGDPSPGIRIIDDLDEGTVVYVVDGWDEDRQRPLVEVFADKKRADKRRAALAERGLDVGVLKRKVK